MNCERCSELAREQVREVLDPLLAALRPFAAFAPHLEATWPDQCFVAELGGEAITVADIRRAAAAIAAAEDTP